MPASTFTQLRLTHSKSMADYLASTPEWVYLDRPDFREVLSEKAMILDLWTQTHKAYFLHHSWKPGLIPVSAEETGYVSALVRGDSTGVPNAFRKMLVKKGWAEDSEESIDLSLLTEKAKSWFFPLQQEEEMRRLLKIVLDRSPRTVLEIGTARGGLLYSFAQVSHSQAFLIGLDIQKPGDDEFISAFGNAAQTVRIVEGDSHTLAAKAEIEKSLNGRKVDLLFIDGDHSYDGVRSDFEMYREFLAQDGLVAFHDIVFHPDVKRYWREHFDASPFKTDAIIGSADQSPPLGIGLVYGAGAR